VRVCYNQRKLGKTAYVTLTTESLHGAGAGVAKFRDPAHTAHSTNAPPRPAKNILSASPYNKQQLSD